ncbi:MAG TPA: MFS transporter [Rariglobus sp.]
MHTLDAPPPATKTPANPDRLGYRELLGYGVGGLPYNLGVDAIKNLANPVYNLLLGLNPVWIGVVMMTARIWDAATDPIMGSVSDNCRSRRGRRRPFIFIGAILCAVSFPLIWMVPRGWGENATLVYFLATSLFFYTSFTVFCVPYMTLGMELSPDYRERTRVSAARMLFAGLSGLLIAWVFRVAHSDFFADPMTGIRVVGLGIGAVFLLTGIPPALWSRERYQKLGQAQPKQSLKASFAATLGKGPFRRLMGITVLVVLGYNTFNAMGIYVNTYYVCGGDLKAAATLQGISGSVFVVALFTAVPLVTWIANRWGKVNALHVCLASGMAGSALKWILFTPAHPYWQMAVPFFIAPCTAGFWVIVTSMKADACDFDELKNGLRREGAFAAISSWLQKFSAALTFSLTGLILVVIGFDQSRGAAQAAGTVFALRAVFSGAPILFFFVCMLLARSLPFTPARMAEVRRELERRRLPA